MKNGSFSPGDIIHSKNGQGHMWKEDLVRHRWSHSELNMLVISVEPVYDRNGDEQVQNLKVLLDGEEWFVSSTNVILTRENDNA
jgi:hypothetical protein